MTRRDDELVNRVVEKVLKDFDFEIDDMLEANQEEVVQAIKDSILEHLDQEPPHVDWIQLVDLDEAEAHKNKNGDFLAA
ncbi:MAG: hypothetical protein HY369_05235 [Candidatus Aenigmarchaeota archaeon]|nr:hypothetical protein [Candidatus Aenigmarchaeota archaeon]